MARMDLPVLEKFCFIFDLKTGCGYMGLISSIFTFILAAMLITFSIEMKEDIEAHVKRDDTESNMSTVVYTIVVLLVGLLFCKLFMDFVFLYAVYKNKIDIMKKYCIFWILFLVLFLIGFLKTLFHMNATYVIIQILFLVENLFYIVVIRSYLISINEDGVL